MRQARIPHDDRSYQANDSKGIDVFKQNLDGTEKRVELGFERVELGPTSNFVGNAMTTGAVDMVQALLQFRRKTPEAVEERDESERPRLLSGKEEIDAAATAAARARAELGSAGPAEALACLSGATLHHRTLRIVEWKEEAGRTVVLLERPYAEDVSWEMSLTASIEPTGAVIDYVMTSKGGSKVLKRYRRDIKDLAHGLDVDRCRCLLGSGTLDELLASSSVDVKNKQIRVAHCDESTVICLCLQRGGCERSEPSGGLGVPVVGGNSEANLNALKSFIRRTRKA